MMDVFIHLLTANQEVDFVQAMLNNFLTNHHEVITQESELVEKVEELKKVTESKFEQMESLLSSNMCMTMYFSGIN